MSTTVADAHHALERAEEKLAEATRARNEARDQLDRAFAAKGWKRLVGAFTPDATPLYTNPLYEATLRADQVIDVLNRQAKAAA